VQDAINCQQQVYETDGRTSEGLLCEPPRMPTDASATTLALAAACPEPRIGFKICEWPRRVRFFCLTASLMRSTSCWYLQLSTKTACKQVHTVWAIKLTMRRSQHSQECKDTCQQCFWDLWPWSFDPKINGFPGLIVEHFHVKLGDHSCFVFWIHRKTGINPITVTAIGAGDNHEQGQQFCNVHTLKLRTRVVRN